MNALGNDEHLKSSSSPKLEESLSFQNDKKIYEEHGDEAELLINAKDKKLHQIYKGLSDAVVKEAFGWDENYLKKT